MNRTRGAFTIIEILVVVMLISLLAVFMVPRFLEKADVAKHMMAKPRIAILEGSLGEFWFDCGRYPTQSEGLKALLKEPPGLSGKWKGYGKEDDLLDPWGNEFHYLIPGKNNPQKYDIFTYGKDNKPGGIDDNADVSNK